jgi:hypothetical protein
MRSILTVTAGTANFIVASLIWRIYGGDVAFREAARRLRVLSIITWLLVQVLFFLPLLIVAANVFILDPPDLLRAYYDLSMAATLLLCIFPRAMGVPGGPDHRQWSWVSPLASATMFVDIMMFYTFAKREKFVSYDELLNMVRIVYFHVILIPFLIYFVAFGEVRVVRESQAEMEKKGKGKEKEKK